MSDVNDKHKCSSWLMYYLGSKNEIFQVRLSNVNQKDGLYYYYCNVAGIQYLKKKMHKILLIYISNFFGTGVVVPEYYIDKLGLNHVIS